MRDSKTIESFLQKKEKESKQRSLFKDLKKEVDTGANGTQKDVIKKGENKGKVADINAIGTTINKLIRFLKTTIESLSVNVTSGGVDSMEKYKYIIGQINAYEATLQELSNLLEDKEQNEGTVIDIKSKNNNAGQ